MNFIMIRLLLREALDWTLCRVD